MNPFCNPVRAVTCHLIRGEGRPISTLAATSQNRSAGRRRTILFCRDGCDLCTRIVDHMPAGSGDQLPCKSSIEARRQARESVVARDLR